VVFAGRIPNFFLEHIYPVSSHCRTQWLANWARDVNRIQKVLEWANIKPALVVTDMLAVSSWATLYRLAQLGRNGSHGAH
jgi:hypothetical protein